MNALVVGKSLFNAWITGSISSRGCTPRVLRSVAGMWLRTASAFLGEIPSENNWEILVDCT